MADSSQNMLTKYLRVIAGAWRDDTRDDAQLLARYVETRDERAFTTLVWRHGPVVWRSCSRVLGRENGADVEDAFQATFLAMSQQAAKLRADTLAGWLHRIARRAALKSVSQAKRRQNLEQKLRSAAQPETSEKPDEAELYAVVDEELGNLPEKLRVPLILRYLEGKSQDEVARTLGCSRSVARKRLDRGEVVLRERLAKRGLEASAITILLTSSLKVPVLPGRLIANTAQAAMAFRAGSLSGRAAEGAHNLLRALSMEGTAKKLWWAVLVCIGTLGLGGGGGWIAWSMFGGADSVTPSVPNSPKMSATKTIARPQNERVDRYGDPLPEGAIARIGTLRFRGDGEGAEDTNCVNWNNNLKANVSLSSDSKTLVLASDDGICFWDVATGKQLRKVAKVCNGISLSPDGKLLAASISGSIHLLDATTGQPSGKPLRGNWAALFTPDGKTVACASNNGSLCLYDVSTRRLLRRMGQKPDCGQLVSAQFSRDGRSVACVYEIDIRDVIHGEVDLLDVQTGKQIATLEYPQGIVKLIFGPEGNIITSGKDKIVRVRDANTGKELRQFGALEQVPTVLAFLPDDKTLLVAGTRQVCFWDVVAGRETRPALACPGLLRPILLSTDGTKLVEQISNAISLWDVTTGKESGPTAGASRSFMRNLAFSPDGTTIATDADEVGGLAEEWTVSMQRPGMAALHLWEVATGKRICSLPVPVKVKVWGRGGISGRRTITWPRPDTIQEQGRYVSETAPVGIFQSRHALVRWKMVPPACADVGKVFPLDEASIPSPDGRVLFWNDGQQRLELFDIASNTKFATVPWSPGLRFTISADHRFLVTQPYGSSTVTLWEIASGKKMYFFDLPAIPGDRPGEPLKFDDLVDFSPDGRLIATCNPKTSVISLWEHVSGQVRWRFSPPTECKGSPCIIFSPDNHLLAAGWGATRSQGCKSIHLWDLGNGQITQCFHGHSAGFAPEIAFSPDGRRLASAGRDYTALIWEVKQPPAPEKTSQPLERKELQALKAALSGIDASAAYRAIYKLQQVPDQAVPLAVECLRPKKPTYEAEQTTREVSHLIDDLDKDNFQIRLKATQELRKQLNAETGELMVQCLLAEALSSGKLAVEVNRTISQLLAELKEERKLGGAKSSELIRMCRAIELLEWVRNDAAREVLQKVAAAQPQPVVRHEAEAALKRLTNTQSAVSP